MSLDESWVALSLVRHIGNKTLKSLLAEFGATDAILKASADDLMQIRGIGQKIADAITAIDVDAVRRDIESWLQAGVKIIPQTDDTYPKILRELDDAPLTLFARGNYHPEQWQPAVAIVGTRHPRPQAKKLAHDLAQQYAQAGWTVISGLALGIDTAAHKGALSCESARTIAVLGGGVLNIYPPQNDTLANTILENSVLLSENAPHATSSAPRLVTRNRIISGLCQRIIVVQSKANGGAMHAAKAAQKQGREVYTVDWQDSGNQALLEQGVGRINPDKPVIPSSD